VVAMCITRCYSFKMRAFKNKWFQKWVKKEGLSEEILHDVACEVVEGRVEADLGGGLFKKRVAKPGRGKSGGYRFIIGFRKGNTDRIIFMFAFAKNERTNITKLEEEVLCSVAESFFSASNVQIECMIRINELFEVKRNE